MAHLFENVEKTEVTKTEKEEVMPAPEGTPLYLQIAWENAWSVPPGEKPHGEYIGKIKTEHGIYYFYQENNKYWFETEYTRQQAERKKRERESRWKYGRYG